MKTRLLYFLPDEIAKRQPIVLFDGDCNLCNYSVQFLLKNNVKKNLNFTSLQSESGKRILSLAGNSIQHTDSVLFLKDNTLSVRSTAALDIAAHLGFIWQIFQVLRIVPLSLRDGIYRIIANNRNKWFGKKSSCLITNEYSDRFIS